MKSEKNRNSGKILVIIGFIMFASGIICMILGETVHTSSLWAVMPVVGGIGTFLCFVGIVVLVFSIVIIILNIQNQGKNFIRYRECLTLNNEDHLHCKQCGNTI